MLKNVLELTRFPGEFENFALPSLVAGSIVLMSSVQPMPLAYEYGYLCFRVLVFSLNTCLINHGYNLDFTIERMRGASAGAHLDLFWGGAADLIAGELSSILGFERRLTHILDPDPQQVPILESGKLDMLLNLLYGDQKNFLLALMTADSLQLSGVLKVRESNDYIQKLLYPYSRIFRRYRLVFPEISHETQLISLISINLPGMNTLRDEAIDDEDSRNIIRSYNRCLRTSQMITCKDAGHHMGFVAPMFTPGCEDLVPSIIDSSFWVLWKTWSKTDVDTAVKVVQAYGVYFWQILKPSRSSSEPWKFKLVDAIMRSDILELTFQVAVKFSESPTRNTEQITRDRINKLLDSIIFFWEKMGRLHPQRVL
ncbi:hypothetical protein V565_215030 [Rhizoctonia solani 123E]|uniref:Uncharacterized protein n=1 Tax=Rhizoctonia solani 123E TaxID=1423351 RepID=A0A074RLF4_9AGAM|nr:hypothetical protein V565_215030 [Rhizoctonia solani 123E]